MKPTRKLLTMNLEVLKSLTSAEGSGVNGGAAVFSFAKVVDVTKSGKAGSLASVA
jgi:hypothetical protein